MPNSIFLNISAEGAQLNPQIIEDRDQAFQTFMQFRLNRTVFQVKAVGIDVVRYYTNENDTREDKQEEAIVVEYGPLHGYIPLSESGYRGSAPFVSALGKYVSVVPERFVTIDGRDTFIFSRSKAIDQMRRSNDDKLKKGINWTGVVRRSSQQGYLLNVGGFAAWMPNSMVDWTYVDGQDPKLQVGQTIEVNIRERQNRRMIVSRRDTMINPFDDNRLKYSLRARYVAKIVTISGLNVYGRFQDGVTVLMRRNTGRDVLRVGASVLCRLTGVNDERKLFEASIERVV